MLAIHVAIQTPKMNPMLLSNFFSLENEGIYGIWGRNPELSSLVSFSQKLPPCICLPWEFQSSFVHLWKRHQPIEQSKENSIKIDRTWRKITKLHDLRMNFVCEQKYSLSLSHRFLPPLHDADPRYFDVTVGDYKPSLFGYDFNLIFCFICI